MPALYARRFFMTATKPRRVKIFFDGGCRPNPGRIEAAVVVRGQTYVFDDLGEGTNSDAEWRALICAVEVAQSLALTDVELIGDAVEVITDGLSIEAVIEQLVQLFRERVPHDAWPEPAA